MIRPSYIYHWTCIVLERHLIVQIEIGNTYEKRHRALTCQPSHGSAGFIAVGFGYNLPYFGGLVEFGRHVEVRCCDFMLISGNGEAHVTANWQKISDSSNINVVSELMLFIINLLTVS